jgi:hypothetical protein
MPMKNCHNCRYEERSSYNDPCNTCKVTDECPDGTNFMSNLLATTPYEASGPNMGDIGTAATSPHYNSLPIQPIELMEATLTHEEFLGYLKGNMIKYAMRAGRKGETQKDVNKYNQYKEFYEYVIQPEHSISDLVK